MSCGNRCYECLGGGAVRCVDCGDVAFCSECDRAVHAFKISGIHTRTSLNVVSSVPETAKGKWRPLHEAAAVRRQSLSIEPPSSTSVSCDSSYSESPPSEKSVSFPGELSRSQSRTPPVEADLRFCLEDLEHFPVNCYVTNFGGFVMEKRVRRLIDLISQDHYLIAKCLLYSGVFVDGKEECKGLNSLLFLLRNPFKLLASCLVHELSVEPTMNTLLRSETPSVMLLRLILSKVSRRFLAAPLKSFCKKARSCNLQKIDSHSPFIVVVKTVIEDILKACAGDSTLQLLCFVVYSACYPFTGCDDPIDLDSPPSDYFKFECDVQRVNPFHIPAQSTQEQETRRIVISNSIFLRFVLPAIVDPFKFGLISSKEKEKCSRALVTLSKVMMKLSAGAMFVVGSELEPLNAALRSCTGKFKLCADDLIGGGLRNFTSSKCTLDKFQWGVDVIHPLLSFVNSNEMEVSKGIFSLCQERKLNESGTTQAVALFKLFLETFRGIAAEVKNDSKPTSCVYLQISHI